MDYHVYVPKRLQHGIADRFILSKGALLVRFTGCLGLLLFLLMSPLAAERRAVHNELTSQAAETVQQTSKVRPTPFPKNSLLKNIVADEELLKRAAVDADTDEKNLFLQKNIHCGAGADQVLASPDTTVILKGYCDSESIERIDWQWVSAPKEVIIRRANTLQPTVLGLSAPGVYTFRLTVRTAGRTYVDTVRVGVSEPVPDYLFYARISGPETAVVGYPLFVELDLWKVRGAQDFVYIAVSGLPHGVHYKMPEWEESCCNGGSRGWSPSPTLLRFFIPPGTKPGNYPIEVQVASGGQIRRVRHQLQIVPVPGPLPQHTVRSVPEIPKLLQWEQNMLRFGQLWCDAEHMSPWEGSVWYYDGMRVYYQIAQYTEHPAWSDYCVPMIRDVYRSMVMEKNGAVQGWRVFSEGLKMDYQEKRDFNSLVATVLLAENSAWADVGGGVSIEESRETAYLIQAYNAAIELGYDADMTNLQRSVAFALGHLDQVAVVKSEPKIKPFMIALTAEALIKHYEKWKDPRIPIVLKKTADFLWYRAAVWDADAKAFLYINRRFRNEDPPEPTVDLNLLIAPLYAWVYQQTGIQRYQRIADTIFSGGVPDDLDLDGYYENGACLGCSGKIFSQNYRWSGDFVTWRQNPLSSVAP